MADLLRMSRLPSGKPEIFASIQGEGVSCGIPSIFIRLALCNLQCAFCDTAYTWNWTRYDPQTEIVPLDASIVVERVLQLAGQRAGPISNVVITGGEPLLQQRALVPLVSILKDRGVRIEVETNGTLRPEPPLAERIDQWNVSPKLASSGNREAGREMPAALNWFAACPHAFFKFVVIDPQDVDEVAALIARYGVPPARVLLMPEGTDAATLAARSSWVVERCQALGYRFGTRLHILLWGDQRGR